MHEVSAHETAAEAALRLREKTQERLQKSQSKPGKTDNPASLTDKSANERRRVRLIGFFDPKMRLKPGRKSAPNSKRHCRHRRQTSKGRYLQLSQPTSQLSSPNLRSKGPEKESVKNSVKRPMIDQ